MLRFRPHLLVALLVGLFVLSGQHGWLREALVDARYKILQRDASGSIALVEMDARSLKEIGAWPWPRSLHAQLIQQLEKAEVADIVFDVDFSSSSQAREDAALADALRQAGGSIVLPAFRQRSSAAGGDAVIQTNMPIAMFAEHAWLASVNVVPDQDGVIRRYSFGEKIGGSVHPSVGALLAGASEQSTRSFRIDYSIRSASVPTASYIDILHGDAEAHARLRGKKVIISGTAAELGDRFTAPNGKVIPGSMIQVLAAESILQDRALATTSPALAVLIIFVMAIVMAFVWRRVGAIGRPAIVIAIAAAIEGVALLIQGRYPVAVDTSLPLAGALAYLVVIAIDEIDLRGLLQKASERRFSDIALSLRDGLVCADRDGVIRLYNPGAQAIFGYAPQEAIGRPFDSLIAASDAAPFALTSLSLSGLQHGSGQVMEMVGVRRTGERFDLECSFSSWGDLSAIQYGVILRDVSARKRQQERVRYLATMDTVTGLYNRDSLLARLMTAPTSPPTLLLLICVDRYQQIIDLHGHSFGDALIAACAQRLQNAALKASFVARLNTDTFAAVFDDAEAGRITSHVLGAAFLNHAVCFGEHQQRVSVTLGIAASDEARTAEELVGNAHFALTDARSRAAPTPIAFRPDMRAAVEKRNALEAELREALGRREFELFYQPQVDLRTMQVVGAEALIRWRHPTRGYVSPGEFMPIVNETSLSQQVARWVMDTACGQAAKWQNLGTPLRMGVNLTQSQFVAGDLAKDVAAALAKTGLRPDLLELEVTENIILENSERTQKMLSALRTLGVKIAFDDFGTGYGSLAYLKAFPLDKIKIDQSFVRDIRDNGDDAAIVRSTIDLSRALGLSVIAEGIESESGAELLLAMGCREGQGYYFGRPVPAHDFEAAHLATRTIASLVA